MQLGRVCGWVFVQRRSTNKWLFRLLRVSFCASMKKLSGHFRDTPAAQLTLLHLLFFLVEDNVIHTVEMALDPFNCMIKIVV